jgi:hypothetical protein
LNDFTRYLSLIFIDTTPASWIEITRRGKPVAVLLSIEEFRRMSAGRPGFWQAYSAFRQSVSLADLEIDPGRLFEGVRPVETGREIDL